MAIGIAQAQYVFVSADPGRKSIISCTSGMVLLVWQISVVGLQHCDGAALYLHIYRP
eukprot:COSAG01_NODE_2169_length_8243_cov_3.244720_4_plen_57_part_00